MLRNLKQGRPLGDRHWEVHCAMERCIYKNIGTMQFVKCCNIGENKIRSENLEELIWHDSYVVIHRVAEIQTDAWKRHRNLTGKWVVVKIFYAKETVCKCTGLWQRIVATDSPLFLHSNLLTSLTVHLTRLNSKNFFTHNTIDLSGWHLVLFSSGMVNTHAS